MLSAIATVLLVPPVNLLFVAFVGLALARRRPVAGHRVTFFALLALLLLALPAVSVGLLAALETDIDAPAGAPPPQAIVILGGDAAPAGPRIEQEEVGTLSLQRVRGGAALARSTGLPVLVTGGVVSAPGPTVPPVAMLRADGIGTVLLVTHAWHMRRALIAFRAAGLTAIPAPLPGERAPEIFRGRFALAEFVPRVSAWERSYFALHEWIGCAWYALQAATHER